MRDDRRGRRWRCEKCGQSGLVFDGCGMSECEAVEVSRVQTAGPNRPLVERGDNPCAQPARVGGEEA